MSPLGIPQAAGITGALTAAGMTSGEVHAWFTRPRQELAGLRPAFVLESPASFPGGGDRMLELARRDAAQLDAALPARWEGSE